MTSQSHMNQGPEDEREQEARKIVQIAACDGEPYGLDNHGGVWVFSAGSKEWQEFPPLPKDDD